MDNRVYSAVLRQPSILPAAQNSWRLGINNVNRSFKLKSISFDITIYDPATWLPLPLLQNFTQFFELDIHTTDSLPFASIFDIPISPVGAIFQTGTHILIDKPIQLFYDSFFISNELVLDFIYNNNDNLATFAYKTCITVETEDK